MQIFKIYINLYLELQLNYIQWLVCSIIIISCIIQPIEFEYLIQPSFARNKSQKECKNIVGKNKCFVTVF